MRKGITLVETIVTVAIIVILAAILIPAMVGYCKHNHSETTAIIELDANERISVEVDNWYQSGNTIIITAKDGTTYRISDTKVIMIESN